MGADCTPAATAPVVVVVAGTHRSGTSVTTGILHRLGFAIGEPVMPPHPDNPTGYFENLRVVELHEEVFAEAGAKWFDLVDVWSLLDHQRRIHWSARAAALLSELMQGADRFVLKDPRLVRLLPMWSLALASLEADVRYVATVRDPAEVAVSLHRRDGFDVSHGEALWNLDMDLVGRHLDGRATVVVYADVLEAPLQAARRLLDGIDVRGDPDDMEAAVQLVVPELNRSRYEVAGPSQGLATVVTAATAQRYRDLVASTRVERA
jgi:hypothetical protein